MQTFFFCGDCSHVSSQTDPERETCTHYGARPQGKTPVELHPLENSYGRFLGDAKEVGCPPGQMNVELLRDTAQTPSTATLLRKFAERFSNKDLPHDLWAYMASAQLYPFHKKLPKDRTSTTDPAL